jgi:hypothetical protein
MFEEERDLTPAAIAQWWDDFERAFWERGCLSADNKEYGTASVLSRDRAKLHWIAVDFTDLGSGAGRYQVILKEDYRLECDK